MEKTTVSEGMEGFEGQAEAQGFAMAYNRYSSSVWGRVGEKLGVVTF